VNRFESRTAAIRVGLAACGLAAAVAVAGCSAGQVSQTAVQQAAVNGSNARIGEITLSNVYLRADLSSDYVRPGSEVELLFVAANGSPDAADKLLSVKSDVGTVTLSGDTTVPPIGVLVVGEPDGQIAPLESVETAKAAKAAVELTKPITNGLTYNFTFTFQRAGETTVPVPLSAGEAPRRDQSGEGGGHGGEGGGHH
jgi:copper(I)-binding protein